MRLRAIRLQHICIYVTALFPAGLAAAIDNSSVIHVHKLEEDPRLLVRMEAFNLPILVATLLSGFTLVSFFFVRAEILSAYVEAVGSSCKLSHAYIHM